MLTLYTVALIVVVVVAVLHCVNLVLTSCVALGCYVVVRRVVLCWLCCVVCCVVLRCVVLRYVALCGAELRCDACCVACVCVLCVVFHVLCFALRCILAHIKKVSIGWVHQSFWSRVSDLAFAAVDACLLIPQRPASSCSKQSVIQKIFRQPASQILRCIDRPRVNLRILWCRYSI